MSLRHLFAQPRVDMHALLDEAHLELLHLSGIVAEQRATLEAIRDEPNIADASKSYREGMAAAVEYVLNNILTYAESKEIGIKVSEHPLTQV